jgi:hypothetical protein
MQESEWNEDHLFVPIFQKKKQLLKFFRYFSRILLRHVSLQHDRLFQPNFHKKKKIFRHFFLKLFHFQLFWKIRKKKKRKKNKKKIYYKNRQEDEEIDRFPFQQRF